jgi:hypothetical protein
MNACRSSKVALNAIVRTLGVQLGAKQQLTTVLMHPGACACACVHAELGWLAG